MTCKQCNGDSKCCHYDDHEKTDLCDKKIECIEFDEWFDTTYGDMFMEDKNVMLLLTFKEVSQKAWEAALRNNRHYESQWQPIETAPLDETVVDLIIDGMRFTDCFYFCGPVTKKWVIRQSMEFFKDDFMDKITHWMIPVLPKIE